VQPGITRLVEHVLLGERIVLLERQDLAPPALHALEHQRVLHGVLGEQVQREERVPEVVEHAHEEHEVEALAEEGHVIDRELQELDLHPRDLGGEARLREVARVGVDPDDAGGAAPLHLDRIEARVAAHVEHALPAPRSARV
jgi:hypothetical protein